MKGLKHNVIEINDTHSESIDRILVFLKPSAKEIAVAASRAEATKILQELEVKKVRPVDRKKRAFAFALAAVAVAVVGLLLLL